MLTLNVVDLRFVARLGQIKDYRIRTYCFSPTGFDINFLTNLSIRASANLFYLPETVNY